MFSAPDEGIYSKEILIRHRGQYNKNELGYFSRMPNDLLVVNPDERDTFQKFIAFLGIYLPARFFHRKIVTL